MQRLVFRDRLLLAFFSQFADGATQEQQGRCQEQSIAQDQGDDVRHGLGLAEMLDGIDGQQGRRNRPQGQETDDLPVDRAFTAVNGRADSLGDRSIKQIRPDRGRRMDTEQQDQKRRHQ